VICRREAAHTDPAALFGQSLVGENQAAFLESVQGRVERSLVDLEHACGPLPNAARDRLAVKRRLLQGLEDEEIERALEKIGARTGHVVPKVNT
jgi:hypothetical protein